MCSGPPGNAVWTSAVTTQGAQEVGWAGGLRVVLRQALQMHGMPAACRKGDRELGTLSGGEEALEANAAVLIITAVVRDGGNIPSRRRGRGSRADRQR